MDVRREVTTVKKVTFVENNISDELVRMKSRVHQYIFIKSIACR